MKTSQRQLRPKVTKARTSWGRPVHFKLLQMALESIRKPSHRDSAFCFFRQYFIANL